MSLYDVYQQLVQEDQVEKIAENEAVLDAIAEQAALEGIGYDDYFEDDSVKTAAELETMGRFMARGYWDEMSKIAQAVAEEEAEEEEEEEEEEEKGKGKNKKKKKALPPQLAAMVQEKKAAFRQAMDEDPEFASELIARYL